MPIRPSTSVPPLRLHKASGQGFVRLDGQFKHLGRYDDPATQQRYHRLVAEWLAGGGAGRVEPAQITVEELMARYTVRARDHYRKPDGRPSRRARRAGVYTSGDHKTARRGYERRI